MPESVFFFTYYDVTEGDDIDLLYILKTHFTVVIRAASVSISEAFSGSKEEAITYNKR